MIAAQSKGVTLNAMSETMDRFFQSLPPGYRPTLRAKGADRTKKDELYFEDRKCGLMYVAADKREAGRGDAYDLALCTEVAAYRDAKEFFGSFTPAMGRRKDTTLVMESTAQPGWFWDKYKGGKTRNESVFLPWSVVPDLYSKPIKFVRRNNSKNVMVDEITGDRVTITAADRKEMAYLSRQHERINKEIGSELLGPVTEAQMYWWHYTCESEYDGDEEWMNQEYPRDDISAFEKSVRGAFKTVIPIVRKTVEETLTSEAFDDAIIGTIVADTDLTDVERDSHRIRVVEDDDVNFTSIPGIVMLKPPVPGYVYTVGCDVADEMGTAADEDDSAFSAIEVYCCNSREQVAEWRGSIDPHDLGDVVAMVGYLYNTAMVNVEYNNMGITTIDRITKYLEYPNRFRWPKFDEAYKLTKKEMWWTDEKTKQLLIGSLRHAIRKGLVQVRTAGLQEELTAYRVSGGSYQAGPDSYADRIMAMGFAWQCVEQTDFGMTAVLGASERSDGQSYAVEVRKGETRAGVPVRPEKRLPDALAAELGDTATIEDTWGVAAEFLGV